MGRVQESRREACARLTPSFRGIIPGFESRAVFRRAELSRFGRQPDDRLGIRPCWPWPCDAGIHAQSSDATIYAREISPGARTMQIMGSPLYSIYIGSVNRHYGDVFQAPFSVSEAVYTTSMSGGLPSSGV